MKRTTRGSILLLLCVTWACSNLPPQTSSENLTPKLDTISKFSANEDSFPWKVNLKGISAGSADEDASQTLTVEVTAADTALIPSIAVHGSGSTRELTLQGVKDKNGSTQVKVVVKDNEGKQVEQSFTVEIVPVNDVPTIASVADQSTLYSVPLDVVIQAAPGGGADEANQPLSATVTAENAAFFSSMSATVDAMKKINVHLVPTMAAEGVVMVTVAVFDGQSQNATASTKFQVLIFQELASVSNVVVGAGPFVGCVPVTFNVAQPQSLPVDVRLEYDSGEGFQLGSIKGMATGLTTSPTGTPHNFEWRSDVDLPHGTFNNVKLRLIATRASRSGVPGVSSFLSTNNQIQFSATLSYPAGAGTGFVDFADLNKDGFQDVLTADTFSNTISYLTNLQNGTLSGASSFTAVTNATCTSPNPNPQFVASGFIDADMLPDVVVAMENCSNLSVMMGSMATTLAAPVPLASGNRPAAVRLADVNKDMKSDLVAVNASDSTVAIFLGQSNGSFAAPVLLSTANSPSDVVVIDVDGDSKLDLVTANSANNNVSLFLGNADGTFEARRDFAGASANARLGTADFNHDGKADVVVTSPKPDGSGNSVAVLLASTQRGFMSPVNYAVEEQPSSIQVADMNNDGQADIVVGNRTTGTLSLLLGKPQGTFRGAISLSGYMGVNHVAVADINNDGFADILSANFTSNVTVSLNQTLRCQ